MHWRYCSLACWEISTKVIPNCWNWDHPKRKLMCMSDGYAICHVNTLRPRQNGHHFTDDSNKCIFVNENVKTLIKISLRFVPKVTTNNIAILVQIMAWRRPGDKPLSEPMMVNLLTHIWVTRPQWVNLVLNTKWVAQCKRVTTASNEAVSLQLNQWPR